MKFILTIKIGQTRVENRIYEKDIVCIGMVYFRNIVLETIFGNLVE